MKLIDAVRRCHPSAWQHSKGYSVHLEAQHPGATASFDRCNLKLREWETGEGEQGSVAYESWRPSSNVLVRFDSETQGFHIIRPREPGHSDWKRAFEEGRDLDPDIEVSVRWVPASRVYELEIIDAFAGEVGFPREVRCEL